MPAGRHPRRVRSRAGPAHDRAHRTGSVLITDGWGAYSALAPSGGYRHGPTNVSRSGQPAHIPLPGVHRVANLVKPGLPGTHENSVGPDHVQAYLDEFTFRFNRSSARHRCLLLRRLFERAVDVGPVTYRSLVVNPRPKRTVHHR